MLTRHFAAGCLMAGAAMLCTAPFSFVRAAAPPVPEQAAPAARQLGTIKAIKGSTITLSTDDGSDIQVLVQDTTRLVRVEPGSKDLKGATALAFKDLQVGDRILIRGQLSSDGKSFTPTGIIAMKHEDVEAKRQHEREEWQKHGIGGLVSAVDPAAGTVTIGVGAGATASTVTLHATKDTIVRRYAPDSVKFDDAKASTLASIKPGDQVRARGTRSADGKDFAADEMVGGSFRNIAGTISAIDATANTISVTDLITKQAVTVKISDESQVKKLPPEIAQRIAARLKGAGAPGTAGAGGPGASGGTAGSSGGTSASAGAPPAAASGGQTQAGGGPGAGGGAGAGAGGARPGGAPDLQQFLSRLPQAKLADLNKGDAVMIVSTEGSSNGQVTAITLLAGIEPILTASPRGAQAMMLSPWALGGGGDAGAGADANP
jgi:hypothetical protein